jgi:two-component system response regulator MprA
MRSPGRVLVVDDDPAIRVFLRDALQAEGYAVEIAPDAGEALDRLWAAWDAQPDVLLLDLLLPGVDGKTFATLYWALPVRHAPIVLMSSMPEGTDVGPQLNAQDVLRKPFDLEELLNRLRQALQSSTASGSGFIAAETEPRPTRQGPSGQ